MSYTRINVIDKDGNMNHYADVHNAFRGAMNIWKQLSDKYLSGGMNFMFDDDEQQRLWNLAYDDKLSLSERMTLLTTFDNIIVKKETIHLVIDSFREFCLKFDGGSLPEQINHLEEIIKTDNAGVAWIATSVCDDAWYSERWSPCELCNSVEYDDDCESCWDREMLPYNINIDTKHKFM